VQSVGRSPVISKPAGSDSTSGAEWPPQLAEVFAAACKRLPGNAELLPLQAEWCTPERVAVYLRARNGDIKRAAETLAQALQFRRDKEDVLTGKREPRWVGDLRVLTRSEDGHPLIYSCFTEQVPRSTPSDYEDHVAAVFESALRASRHGAESADVIIDCQGFRLSNNLDPRPAVGAVHVMRHPFRDCLRTGIIVDAPPAFSIMWRALLPVMSEEITKRVVFLSREEAEVYLAQRVGASAAADVSKVMERNRAVASRASNVGKTGLLRLPCELGDFLSRSVDSDRAARDSQKNGQEKGIHAEPRKLDLEDADVAEEAPGDGQLFASGIPVSHHLRANLAHRAVEAAIF